MTRTSSVEPGAPARLRLDVSDDDLVACVSCGLCLPHCPTFRVTGEEARSPRGRIATMRAIESGAIPAGDHAVLDSIDTCIGCRGCEAACPSGVPFGRLLEATRSAIHSEVRPVPRWLRVALSTLGRHRLLLAGSSLLGVAQRLRLLPAATSARLGLPKRAPIRRPPLRSSRTAPAPLGDVWLFTGCVMDAWMRPTHLAAIRLLEAAGARVLLAPEAGCCGALHLHAGLHDAAGALARRVVRSMPGDAPVLVDSAGCGAALQEVHHLLATPEAAAFSARVADVHEWLGAHVDRLPPPGEERPVVAVQDPCHLRHVQAAHGAVRAVLGRYAELRDTDDDGLCCGAGGAYAVMQPDLAGEVRDRKVASLARTGATFVASANPGCSLHLRGAGVDARHPLDLVAELADQVARPIEEAGGGR